VGNGGKLEATVLGGGKYLQIYVFPIKDIVLSDVTDAVTEIKFD